MRCASCGHENREHARFCGNCGAPLAAEVSCPECGAANSPGQRFCDSCAYPLGARVATAISREPPSYTPKHLAEKILTSRSALEGERKQVTVLFADVQGSVALSQGVDAETFHKIMDGFFVILSDGVHRFDGTVNQYTGDGIMALFGAPIAHEDHARRACYAALHLGEALRRYAEELKRTQGLGFVVRMGLNSGEVVVGKIGDDLRMDYTAQGHTVGLAARMEQLADPGKIYLSQYTAALVAGFFRLRDLGQFSLKGVREPLRVCELEGVGPLRTRLDVSRARGFSRFVGRDEETARLEAALRRASEERGEAMGVVGEAGVGKSRLCYEFVQRCRARGVDVYEAHAVAHGKAIPFLPVLELFRSYFGIAEQDGDRMARDKIAGRLLLLDEAFRETLPLVFEFLGVPDPERPVPRMEPEARQRHLFGAVTRLLRARRQPEAAVVLCEDLHWLDGASEAFMDNFVQALPGGRTLLLVTFRPEYQAAWMRRSYYEQVPLSPLGPEAIAELLRDLLGTDPSLAGLADGIRSRTGGNPFFVEEIVQALVEGGNVEGSKGAYRLIRSVDEPALPATVDAVLAARIDRLAECHKGVLQTAAVIGREFSEPVLRRVVSLSEPDLAAALRALAEAEFIYEEAPYPEAEYTFKHPLTQEVAYRSQLTERRVEVHAAVARTIAGLYPDKLDERAALLAHHWESAGEALEAARWHRRAAEWAGVSNLSEALRHWRQVRALVDNSPRSKETAALGLAARIQVMSLGWRLESLGEEAATLFAEGRQLAAEAEDPGSLAMLVAVYGAHRSFITTTEEFVAHELEATRLADQTDDAGLRLALRAVLTHAHYLHGSLEEALAVADQAVEQPPSDPTLGIGFWGFSPYVFLVLLRGALLRDMGQLTEAAREIDRAAKLAREHGDVEILGWVHQFQVILARVSGDTRDALEHAHRAVEVAEKLQSRFSVVAAYNVLGLARMLNAEWNGAVEVLEKTLETGRAGFTNLVTDVSTLAYLAEAYLGQGAVRRAHTTAEDALALARRHRARAMEIHAQLVLARVLLRVEGAKARGAIEDALGKAQALVEETGARIHKPFIHEERAELARLTGDEDVHERELREAYRLFIEMSATGPAERLRKELGL